MDTKQKILIADDHAIVRSGIKLLLQYLIPSVQITESATGEDVLKAVKKENFNLVILDLNMPETDSFTLVWNILAYKRDAKVLIFSINPSSIYAKRFLKMGVLGYLQKNATQEELKQAILTTINGQVYKLPSQALQAGMNGCCSSNPFEKLSDRELQVAKCILMGYSYEQMEQMLHLESTTIATHRFRLYKKLEVQSLAGLVHLANHYDFDGGYKFINLRSP